MIVGHFRRFTFPDNSINPATPSGTTFSFSAKVNRSTGASLTSAWYRSREPSSNRKSGKLYKKSIKPHQCKPDLSAIAPADPIPLRQTCRDLDDDERIMNLYQKKSFHRYVLYNFVPRLTTLPALSCVPANIEPSMTQEAPTAKHYRRVTTS